jgi:citrate lyase subunit beta / citryl-CoA lyase
MSVLPRSYLFVPGNRPERFDKALACGADAVVFDLEDAVPVAEKEHARAAVAGWLREHRDAAPSPQRLVRVNASGTPQHEADVAACHEGVSGLVLPKSEQVAHLVRLAQALPAAALLPLVETAAGMAAAAALARAPKVQRLVFGSIDF